ncbi:MAG: hypothetical protein RIS34_1450 [Pseudomonadota bacterium]|jgi:restriction system protein
MKLKMSDNSLFAILLRSPWWLSFALVALFALASRALLPEPYVAFGVMGGFPFLVIGILSAWRQWRAPSPARVSLALQRVAEMSWQDFSREVEQGYGRQGYVVTRPGGPAADFQLLKNGQTTLVSCKRWKAANQGLDALRDLIAAAKASGAHHSTCITLGNLTGNAQRFAQEHGIHVMSTTELAQLVMNKNRP